MEEKTKKIIKDNLLAVREMAIDLGIKSIDLLDPAVLSSPEIALTQVMNLGRTFVIQNCRNGSVKFARKKKRAK